MKSKVSLKLRSLSGAELLKLLRSVIEKMTNNPNFPTPIPSLTSMEAEIDEYEKSLSLASQGGKDQTANFNERRRKVELLLTQLGHYVEDTAQGSDAIILSSGIDSKKIPSIIGVPEAPKSLSIARAAIPGNFKISWEKIDGARVYIVEKNTNGNWEQHEIVPKTTYVIENETLGSGNTYRVLAFGTAGRGPASDPIHIPSW
jgi:hypothetical protein